MGHSTGLLAGPGPPPPPRPSAGCATLGCFLSRPARRGSAHGPCVSGPFTGAFTASRRTTALEGLAAPHPSAQLAQPAKQERQSTVHCYRCPQ